MPGTATTAAHMAGTRKMLDTFSRSIMSRVWTGSNAPDCMITLVPPTSSGGRPPARPAMWNSGAPGAATRSSGCQPRWVTWLNTCMSRLWWVSTAPFGRPVVPDVYMMNAGSSSSTTTSSGSSPAAASAASNSSPMTSTVATSGACSRALAATPASAASTTSAVAPESAST